MIQIREKLVNSQGEQFGDGDVSYRAAGCLDGLNSLTIAFYHYMDTLLEAEVIREMHRSNLALSQQKLAYFLSGWLGGPKLYSEHFGSINIPTAHKHLPIGENESEAWLLCMQKAVDEQNYEEDFKTYLMAQFRVPAGRITSVCRR